MSRNIESEVIKRIQNSSVFALQLDETTDITKMSQLIIYVRFIFNEDITEAFLCCKSLEGKTTGEKIFEVIKEYFLAKSLIQANCATVCTDGAAALRGSNNGLRGLIQKVVAHMVFNRCMIHRQGLVAKDMDEELHNILHKTLLVQLTTLNATVLKTVSFQCFAMRWAQRRRDYCFTPKGRQKFSLYKRSRSRKKFAHHCNRACVGDEAWPRRIAARQPPPTCLPELRRALLDEWCNIPQDQIDNLILSMPRRYKACIASSGRHTPYKPSY
ncbi:zinc finger MYM-type protein 6 [Trichonephila clavipes]|nr:zinc finger MYM-type protein 6 [Trichonephila clavipes]